MNSKIFIYIIFDSLIVASIEGKLSKNLRIRTDLLSLRALVLKVKDELVKEFMDEIKLHLENDLKKDFLNEVKTSLDYIEKRHCDFEHKNKTQKFPCK